MPIYEYICEACGHQLEVIQKLSDAPLLRCPNCDKDELRKMVSAPAFRLSGTGWYETDFKSDKEKRRNLTGTEPAAKVEKTSDSGTTDKKGDKPTTKSDGAKPDKAAAPAKKAS